MNAAGYFTAAIPEPFRILGLQLKPLSLGRYRLLKRFDVAFVSDETKGAGPGDLILGVLICAMRCDEFLLLLNSPKFARTVRRWGRKICPEPWIAKIPWIGRRWHNRFGRRWRERHGFNIIEKIQLFQRYITGHSQVPKYWDESESSSVSAAHWAQSVESVLRSEVGWSQEEINESPLCKAFADYFKWAESNGAIRLMADGEEEEGRKNAEALAAMQAQEAAPC